MPRIKRLARVIAALLSSIILFTTLVASNVSAQIGNTVFENEGYTVDYKIISEWAGNQSIEVVVTNTGAEPILNWALKYDAKGTITGLWNGVIYENRNTEYVIKKAGYNYEIAPNQSVNFGYTLSGETLSLPDILAVLKL